MTGEQLGADIYLGPTYYMRLKHMVKDKINYRARGPNTVLTRQPVQGRANDGGLRIGEMERDGVLAHGMSYFLNESFMIRGERNEYFIAVCNKTGTIAIYNEPKNLFLSMYADGPIKFITNPDGSQNIKNLSRFGRSFSILRIPYALKLLIQELQVMNIQMRIITDENVDQLLSMSYSNNITKLLEMPDNTDLKQSIDNYVFEVKKALSIATKYNGPNETPELPEPVEVDSSIPYAPYSPAYEPTSDELNQNYNATSPAYVPGYSPNESPPQYAYSAQPNTINITSQLQQVAPPPTTPPYNPNLPLFQPVINSQPIPQQVINSPSISPPIQQLSNEIQSNDSLPEVNPPSKTNILEVEEPAEEKVNSDKSSDSGDSQKKKVAFEEPESSSNSSAETKKITL
jgi:hypothetical protein